MRVKGGDTMKALEQSKLQIRVEKGLDGNGSMKYEMLTFSRVAEEASDDAIQAVGAALGTLQTKTVADIIRVDNSILRPEA